jgi:hypothetical protein
MAAKAKRIGILSDLHVNSIVAPWPKDQPLEGGGKYAPNKPQIWLNRCWADMVSRIGDLDVLVINGDTIQGINARDKQLVTTAEHIQHGAACKLLKPLTERAERTFINRGTEFHDGLTGEHVENLAEALGAVRDKASGQHTRWELFLNTCGGVIHFQHSIGVAGVPTTEATVPWRDTLNFISELMRAYGKAAPNVQMRVFSHRHRCIYVNAPPFLHALVTPAWQLKTAYVHKKGGVMQPHIGFAVVEASEGCLNVRPHVYPLIAPGMEVA